VPNHIVSVLYHCEIVETAVTMSQFYDLLSQINWVKPKCRCIC